MVERIYALYIQCRKSLLADDKHSIDIASFDEYEEKSERVLQLLPRMEVSTKKIFGFTHRLLKIFLQLTKVLSMMPNLQLKFIHLFGSSSPQKRYTRRCKEHMLVDHITYLKHRWSKTNRR
ncbi:hypothetical protein SELMODRAFT_409879 [Selaginella moellendorffii]|uniref:Uncharacterized protein n=1 Tax=Selaginella moellendorffii TaxID=88036 RepID=D8RCR9_SELML|nr:hypothetical protein SELMODRAFT_409879 [Selaginella moellendorffii]